MRPRATRPAGRIGIGAHVGVTQQVPDLVVGIAGRAIAPGGGICGPGEPVQVVIPEALIPMPGIGQAL